MSVWALNWVCVHETQKFYHGATLAGHFHFRLRSTISVHKFRSTTTSVDISSPQYSFITCAWARMNELKMLKQGMPITWIYFKTV